MARPRSTALVEHSSQRGGVGSASTVPHSPKRRRAFEQFTDFVVAQRERFPDMHVYHYAPYEPTAMKRLMGLHATREDEIDQLLRQNVLVDLYRVVEQGLRISQSSYSIKKVEAFYMPEREASVTDGEDSSVKFEEWLDTGEQPLLDWIEEHVPIAVELRRRPLC